MGRFTTRLTDVLSKKLVLDIYKLPISSLYISAPRDEVSGVAVHDVQDGKSPRAADARGPANAAVFAQVPTDCPADGIADFQRGFETSRAHAP